MSLFKKLKDIFSSESYYTGYEDALRREGIINSQDIAGVFSISKDTQQFFKSQAYPFEGVEGIVFVADVTPTESSAYVVTKTEHGTYNIYSILNVARPNDRKLTTRRAARDAAIPVRRIFESKCSLVKPRANKLFAAG